MSRWLSGTFVFVLVATGCVGPIRSGVDGVVCELAALPRDGHLAGKPTRYATPAEPDAKAGLLEKLDIPTELPGAEAPKLDLPSPDVDKGRARKEALRTLYPDLPPVGPDSPGTPGPGGKPLTLGQLQNLAMSNNPALRQAAARVEAARGAAVQAGLPPNPTVGIAGNTVGTANTAGQLGPYFDQVWPLGNKLQLARAVAAMDLRLAEIALRRAELDVLTEVRRAFFKRLVAQESIRVLRALERMAHDVHRVHTDQVILGTEAAPYEPLQTRAQATQARAALVRARHQAVAAWKGLAVAVGLPGLPETDLAGNLQDMPLPLYEHAAVLDHVLKGHTDLLTAEAGVMKARHGVARARALNIPDLEVNVQVTPDFTTPRNPITPTFTVGLNGLPVWHRNHGAIAQAEAELSAADNDVPRVRNDLAGRLAEAFGRFAAARDQVVLLRDGALPDQVRAYRALRDRYVRDPSLPDSSQPNFQDVINAQLNLGQLMVTYLGLLDDLTGAMIDVADLAQTDDLFALARAKTCLGPIGLELVTEDRPCSPLPAGPFQRPARPWPAATIPLGGPPTETKPKDEELPAPNRGPAVGEYLPPIDPARLNGGPAPSR